MRATNVLLCLLIYMFCVSCGLFCKAGMRGKYKVFGGKNNPFAVRLDFKCSGSVYLDTNLTTLQGRYELDGNRVLIKNSSTSNTILVLTKKKDGTLIGPAGFEYTLESR